MEARYIIPAIIVSSSSAKDRLSITLNLRFCEKGTRILRNHHLGFVPCSNRQIYGGDFAKFCGLLRIYELYCCLKALYSGDE